MSAEVKSVVSDVQISKYRVDWDSYLGIGGHGVVGGRIRPNIVRSFFVSGKLAFRGTFWYNGVMRCDALHGLNRPPLKSLTLLGKVSKWKTSIR